MTDPTDEAERRSRLNGIKLRALVRDHLGVDGVAEPERFAPGAALVNDGVAWVLLDREPASRLGAALVWASRRGASAVNVVAEVGTGILTRRASAFAFDVAVWHAEGRTLLPAVAEPHLSSPSVPAHHEAFRATIVDGGAEPLVEHGVLVGEVRGLEVCRVVDDRHLGTTRLEVGIGAHDREAFQMMHGDTPTSAALARVVEVVAEHRRVGAPQHPLNRLAAERFVRWRLIDDPSLVGMVAVTPTAPPVVRANLKDPVPCVAIGTDAAGATSVIVCSSGVDLDLVPFAADARLAVERRLFERDGVERDGVERGVVERDDLEREVVERDDLELRIVLPARDQVRATDEIAAMLRRPPTIVTLD